MTTDINQVIEDLKPIVAEIEKSPATTKGRYDRYMIILSKFPPTKRRVFAAILIKAGANEYGVTSALSLLNI